NPLRYEPEGLRNSDERAARAAHVQQAHIGGRFVETPHNLRELALALLKAASLRVFCRLRAFGHIELAHRIEIACLAHRAHPLTTIAATAQPPIGQRNCSELERISTPRRTNSDVRQLSGHIRPR